MDRLEFAAGRSNWGCRLRSGLISVSANDFVLISAAMGAGMRDPGEPTVGGANGAAAGDKG
jgi:hypothetical protein